MQSESDTNENGDEARDRASERRNFFLSTTLTTSSHGQIPARVRNLSAGGMMIEVASDPDPELASGQRLVAELRNIGRVKGEIAWARGRRFGIKFDNTIDPEQARKPVTAGEGTPDYIKPVLVPDRSLRNVRKGW